jgi:hypothetical protein
VLVHGLGGSEEGLICMAMSQNTLGASDKAYILQLIKATLGIDNDMVDTEKMGADYLFDGHHYGVWGKMSKSVSSGDFALKALPDLIPSLQGKLAPQGLHPREFLGNSSQPAPYLDRAVRLLSDNFNASHFMHCPSTHFNQGIRRILAPALLKVSS